MAGLTRIKTGGIASGCALPSDATATTQSANDNSTKLATTAYVDAATGGSSSDKIEEGNSKVEVVDTNGTGHVQFHTEGSERMRLSNTGQLILGSSTVAGGSGADQLTVNSTGNTGITIRSGSTSDGNIYFSDATSGNGQWAGYISYNHNHNKLGFWTNYSGSNNHAALFIDSAGRIGVNVTPSDFGTNAKAIEIHSSNSVNSFLALTNSTTGSGGVSHGFNIIMSNNEARLFNRENDDITFWTNSAEGMRLDNTGNLGIGTSDPKAMLQVGNGAASKHGKLLISADSGLQQYIQFTNGGGSQTHYPAGIWYQPSQNMELRAASGATTSNDGQLVLSSNGNVGINDTSPSTRLHVSGPNTSSRGQLSLEGQSADARMTFYRGTDFIGAIMGNSNHINIATENGHHIEFSPEGTEVARFTSNGLLFGDVHVGRGNSAGHTSNQAFGVLAGENLGWTAYYNVCLGYEGGRGITTGDQNVMIGFRAGGNGTFTGHDNVGIGNEALQDCSSGYHNVCIGREAAQNLTTGYSNTFIGERAGYVGTVTGYWNVAVGTYAAGSITSGYDNNCMGTNAGANITTGMSNVCIGEGTGLGLVGGGNNTFVGHGAGSSGSPSGSVTGNHNVVFGNNNVTDIWCADTSISSSDQRDKADITDFTHGLDWVTQMRPITYKWDKRSWYVDWDANPDTDLLTVTTDGTHKKERVNIGLLAQDIQAIEQSDGFATNGDNELICRTTDDGTQISLKYERIVPVLINAIKELKTANDALTARVAALEAG